MDEQAESPKSETPSTDEAAAVIPSEFDRFHDLPIQAAVYLDRRRLRVGKNWSRRKFASGEPQTGVMSPACTLVRLRPMASVRTL